MTPTIAVARSLCTAKRVHGRGRSVFLETRRTTSHIPVVFPLEELRETGEDRRGIQTEKNRHHETRFLGAPGRF